MNPQVQTPPAPPQTAPPPIERLTLCAVPWEMYEKLLDAFAEHHIRMTYDRGNLEIMAPLWNHEWWKRQIALFVLVLCEQLGLPLQGGGSTTFRRQDVARGLEPDECFYIRNAHRMTGPREVDLSRDPPPDLAIEVDITRSCLDRMGVYAALGVGELWVFEGDPLSLQVYCLTPQGTYEPSAQSRNFPFLPLQDMIQCIHDAQGLDDIGLMQAFRVWIKQHIPTDWKGTTNGPQQPS